MNNLEELEKAVSAFRLCSGVREMFNVADNVKAILGRLSYSDIEKARATAPNSASTQLPDCSSCGTNEYVCRFDLFHCSKCGDCF